MARKTTTNMTVILSARRVTRRLERINDQLLAPAGLNPREFAILAYLYKARLDSRPGALKSALAEFTSMPLSAVSRYVDSLERQGWVALSPRTADRKKRHIAITANGCARFQRAVPFWYRAQERIRNALGIEAAAALDRILELTSTRLRK